MFLVLNLVEELAENGTIVIVKRKNVGLLGVCPVFDTKEHAENSLKLCGKKGNIVEITYNAK